MQTLVTGGAGFIGSAIARALLERGHGVKILDNFLTGFKENVPAEAELVDADLRDLDGVSKACLGADVIFHQAALRSVSRSVEDPLLSATCNVIGTLNVLMGAEKAGAHRVVYASSSSVYGNTDQFPTKEQQLPDPISPYAVSKLAGEQYCGVWSELKDLTTVSLRYFNVFGPGQHPESKYSAVFPAFVSALVNGNTPEVHWDGEQGRDFSYIDDVVSANLKAAEAPDSVDGGVFNIGGGGSKTVNQVLDAVSKAVGTTIEPEYSPRRDGDVRHTEADISLARDKLGWTPEAQWDKAVGATVDWFKGARKTP